MAWFKKKDDDEDLPELPGAPKLPPLPKISPPQQTEKISFQINEAPTFQSRPLPPLPVPIKVKELDTENMKKSITPEIRTQYHEPSKEPIFVKIDNFQTAAENFNKIKQKIEEIEDTLEQIKEQKAKEEEEIKEWEHEIQMIKSRIGNIDDSLFSKIGED